MTPSSRWEPDPPVALGGGSVLQLLNKVLNLPLVEEARRLAVQAAERARSALNEDEAREASQEAVDYLDDALRAVRTYEPAAFDLLGEEGLRRLLAWHFFPRDLMPRPLRFPAAPPPKEATQELGPWST